MAELEWDQEGERTYETGVEKGVLYKLDVAGAYNTGFAWNGLTSVGEKPSGAEANKQYANNKLYANLTSAEEFSATLEAFTYPDEFAECDGSAEPVAGITIGQQPRKGFGLSYKTLIGNDLNEDAGYKLHLVWGCKASPTEKSYNTVNESPELSTFSWELSTTPIDVPGFKSTATMVIDSTKVPALKLTQLEDILYGKTVAPLLPKPSAVIAIFDAA